jgi:hypothetical protein
MIGMVVGDENMADILRIESLHFDVMEKTLCIIPVSRIYEKYSGLPLDEVHVTIIPVRQSFRSTADQIK